jgi:uncharacterized membrane protein YbhN (UPF0104 family)
LLLVAQIVLGAERWRTILRILVPDRAMPVTGIYAAFYAGAFFNCFPLGNLGGDIARVILGRQLDMRLGPIITSVLIDHGVALIGLFVLAALTLPSIAHPLATSAWIGAVAILIATAVGFQFLWIFDYVLGRWRDRRLVNWLLHLAAQLQSLRQPRIIVTLLWTLLSLVCAAVSTYLIARTLGIAVGPIAMAAVMSLVTLIVILPISIAGWGIREVSFVTLLGLLGVEREAAFLLSVEVGLLTMLVSLPGAVLWLIARQPRSLPAPEQAH